MTTEETIMIADKDNPFKDANSYFIIATDESVDEEDFEKVVQIVDELGQSVACTVDRFVEIFDREGLAGFIR